MNFDLTDMENQSFHSRSFLTDRSADQIGRHTSAPVPYCSNKRPLQEQGTPRGTKIVKARSASYHLSHSNMLSESPPQKKFNCSSEFEGELVDDTLKPRHISPRFMRNDGKNREFLKQNGSPETMKLVSSFYNMSLGSSKSNSLKLPFKNSCSRPEINCITPDLVSELVQGNYKHLYDIIIVIDCRYGYEFEGGHIRNARNHPEGAGLEEFFKELKDSTIQYNKICLVFHCEFSSHRAPYSYKKFRDIDKKFTGENNVTFSEIYLLEGGYKAFYTQHSKYCDPENYRTMDDPDFAEEYKKIKHDKANIIETSKSRKGTAGLSKSSVNLFGNYHESPTKSTKAFLFDDTPVKQESPRSNYIYGGDEKEIKKRSGNIFSDQQLISFDAFSDEIVVSEDKKREKTRDFVLRRPFKGSLSNNFGGSKSCSNLFENIDSPFKTSITPPHLKNSSSKVDLFQSKGITTPPKVDLFNVSPQEESQIISKRPNFGSPRNPGDEEVLEMQEDLDLQTPYRPYKPPTPKVFPRYETEIMSLCNSTSENLFGDRGNQFISNDCSSPMAFSRSESKEQLFARKQHRVPNLSIVDHDFEDTENQPISNINQNLSQSHNSIFSASNSTSSLSRTNSSSNIFSTKMRGRSGSAHNLLSNSESETRFSKSRLMTARPSSSSNVHSQISPRYAIDIGEDNNTPYRARTKSNTGDFLVKNSSGSFKKGLEDKSKLARIRSCSGSERPLSRSSSGSQLFKKNQLANARQIVTSNNTMRGSSNEKTETDWAQILLLNSSPHKKSFV